MWKTIKMVTSNYLSIITLNVSRFLSEVAQSCPTLCDPMDCSLPGSPVRGILQARTLEWVAISFSRGSSQPRDWTQVSSIAGRSFPRVLQNQLESRILQLEFQPRNEGSLEFRLTEDQLLHEAFLVNFIWPDIFFPKFNVLSPFHEWSEPSRVC